MRLTPSFALHEFLASGSHPELVRPIPQAYRSSIRLLAVLALQPLRDTIERSVRILSGYRSPELNAAVGGSPTSQHVLGQAVDITTEDVSGAMEALIAMAEQGKLPGIGQVIYYPKREFIHIALVSDRYPTFSPFLSTTPGRYREVPATVDEFRAALRGAPAVVTV